MGALWTPASLDNLACWLDVADTAACPRGSPNYTWDKSINRYQLAAGGARTSTVNGQYYYSDWSGTGKIPFASSANNHYGEADRWTRNRSALSAFWVARRSSGSSTGPFFSANNYRVQISQSSTQLKVGGLRLDANSFQELAVSCTGFQFNILGAMWDWANAKLYADVNGTLTERSGGFQTAGSTSDTSQVMRILSNASTEYWSGDFCEFLSLWSIPDDDTRQLIEGYLAHKWGQAGYLASNHPWKSAAPYALGGGVIVPNTWSEIGGNATKVGGGTVAVVAFDWATGARIATAEPDGSGDWTLDIVTGRTHGLTYLAASCAPITHGPYTVT